MFPFTINEAPLYQKKEFAKAQVAAFIGTAVDYMTVILLTEWVGLWYVYSNAVGAACGAVTNFLLGRNWAFEAMDGIFLHQALRYALVSFGSLLLNTAGVYLLTEFTSLNYLISKVFVGILVAFTYNYLLQKRFVFRKKP